MHRQADIRPPPDDGVELQMGGADRWATSAGLERSWMPPPRLRARSGASPRPRACCSLIGDQVRQKRDGGVCLARSRPDVAVCLLPVLAQHRRRDVGTCAGSRFRSHASRRSSEAARAPEGRPAQRALATSRPGTGRRRPWPFRGEVLRRGHRPTVLRSLYRSTGRFTFDPAGPGSRGRPGRAGSSPPARLDGMRRRGGRQRHAGVRPGHRPGRSPVARPPDGATPRDQPSTGGGLRQTRTTIVPAMFGTGRLRAGEGVLSWSQREPETLPSAHRPRCAVGRARNGDALSGSRPCHPTPAEPGRPAHRTRRGFGVTSDHDHVLARPVEDDRRPAHHRRLQAPTCRCRDVDLLGTGSA
jgi:hypothetical protein